MRPQSHLGIWAFNRTLGPCVSLTNLAHPLVGVSTALSAAAALRGWAQVASTVRAWTPRRSSAGLLLQFTFHVKLIKLCRHIIGVKKSAACFWPGAAAVAAAALRGWALVASTLPGARMGAAWVERSLAGLEAGLHSADVDVRGRRRRGHCPAVPRGRPGCR